MTKKQLRVMMGMNIRNERKARHLSIEEFAEMLGLTPGFIGLIERGDRGATPYTLYKISDIFEMPLGPLFGDVKKNAVKEPESAKKVKRNKISSLAADLTEIEMDFVIQMIKGIKNMNKGKELRKKE